MTDIATCTISDACNLCGACIEVCPLQALVPGETKVVLSAPDECLGGGMCEAVCPQNAIQCSFDITWDAPENGA